MVEPRNPNHSRLGSPSFPATAATAATMPSSADSGGDRDDVEYEDDVSLAEFLESEVLGDEDETPGTVETLDNENGDGGALASPGDETDSNAAQVALENVQSPLCIQTGSFGRVPPELFHNILRFLSSEDLSTCTSVCRFLRDAASDEGLWRKLYCLRWGPPSGPSRRAKPRGSAWKNLYFERDQAEMVEFVRKTPAEFREYYIQMQAAKRNKAPLPSQVHHDLVVLDTSIADQITSWRRSHSLADVYIGNHWCSGRTCSYFQIGDVFLCEKTGRAHICDDTCPETVLDPSNELLVCTVSGRCFDRWLTPAEEDGPEPAQQQADANNAAEEGEPYLGSGRLGRAYLLGYNCADERELDEAMREVVYPSHKRAKKSSYDCCYT